RPDPRNRRTEWIDRRLRGVRVHGGCRGLRAARIQPVRVPDNPPARVAAPAKRRSANSRRLSVRPAGSARARTAGVRSNAGPPSRRPARLRRVTAVLFTCAGQRVDIVTEFGKAGAVTV